ncbi:MAG: hypothetical protein WC830_15470 [Burkholderiales bacterium]
MGNDEQPSNNLFLVLGKYVDRQDENLLTQALVVLFNRVTNFRETFCALVENRVDGRHPAPNPRQLEATPQKRRHARGRDVLVDMDVSDRETERPVYLVESKLEAGLGPKQLQNYKAALKRLPKSVTLVLLTRHGIDQTLWQHAPSRTIWLSWSLVVEAAIEARKHLRESSFEYTLLKDFVHMTETKGIRPVPPMTTDAWRRLPILSRYILQNRGQTLDYRTVTATELAFQRLLAHRDSAWERTFSADRRWHPYQSIYDDDGALVLQVGYWRSRPRKNIQQSYIGLELECTANPKLYVVYGWQLGRKHPNYDACGPFEFSCPVEMSPGQTRKLFKERMPAATDSLRPRLARVIKRFVVSKYR